jgi:hypothetical protein
LELTPIEISWKIEAFNKAEENRTAHEWFLGRLIGIAVNSPKDYPKLSEFAPSQKPQEKTNWNARRREAAKYGLRIPR